MPATAGRVRMPANNRVHSSAALQTHGIWQSAIGYDPYAPQKDESKAADSQNTTSEAGAENAYLSFQGLLQLAKITNNTENEVRGACKKCGRVGHLTFQCKNFVSLKEEIKNKDLDVDALAELEKVKRSARKASRRLKGTAESSEESSDESESSDSSYDSEIERAIAKRFGKKKGSSVVKKRDESDDEDEDEDSGERKKRGRSKKRSSRKRSESDSEDEDDSRRKKRKEKRRKKDESSEEDEDRRERGRKSRKEKSRRRRDDFEESRRRRHKRKNRRAAASDSDVSGSDDSRVGRNAKRADKKSHKRHHDKD